MVKLTARPGSSELKDPSMPPSVLVPEVLGVFAGQLTWSSLRLLSASGDTNILGFKGTSVLASIGAMLWDLGS